jgi:hypothetical protein
MDLKPTHKANRRRSPRRLPKRTTRITCHKGSLGLGPNIALSMLNLSETGVCLLVKENLETGSEVEVRLINPIHRQPLRTLAEVIWCVETKDGAYCIGAHFRKPLLYRDLLEIGLNPS